MDLSLAQTSPGAGSKSYKKRKRKQRAKNKALENNGPKASHHTGDNSGASGNLSECHVTNCDQEENLHERDLDRHVPVQHPEIVSGSIANSSKVNNGCKKKKKKRKKIKKKTAASCDQEENLPERDLNQHVPVEHPEIVSVSTANSSEVNKGCKRKKKRKKTKKRTAEVVGDVQNVKLMDPSQVDTEPTENINEGNASVVDVQSMALMDPTQVVAELTENVTEWDVSGVDVQSVKLTDLTQVGTESTEIVTEGNAAVKRKRKVKKKRKKIDEEKKVGTESTEIVTEGNASVKRKRKVKKKRKKIDEEKKEEECLLQDIVQPSLVEAIISNRRKLLVLDVNGLLADIMMPAPKDRRGDIHILGRAIFRRPFCDEFLQFCFQNFDVAVWSSRSKKIIDRVVEYLLGDLQHKLLFCWDMEHSTQTGYRTLENCHKPLVCKELKKIWENDDPELPWKKGDYDESNTLLLDDSPYKALLNPLNTAIFPKSYHYEDKNDNALGPGGDLRVYLEAILKSDNVQKYVEQHPFGQSAINETHSSWDFYSGVLQTLSSRVENNTTVSLSTLS